MRLRCVEKGLDEEEIQEAKRGVMRHVTFCYLVFCFSTKVAGQVVGRVWDGREIGGRKG